MKLAVGLVAALLALASGAHAESRDYASPGPLAARTVDETWTDNARHREVPVRLRLPETGEKVPVIVFSHGLGGSRAGGAEWGAHWASHGFAVVHVQHPGSDESIWKDRPAGERLAGLRQGISLEQFAARIADVKFVLDELERRQLALLDLRRLGMSGHSFGAVTTLYLGGQRPAVGALGFGDLSEKRFAAFLAFSPQAAAGSDPHVQFADFARPALLVTGTLDGQPVPGIGASPERRLVPFEAMPGGDKFLLVIDQADHMFFNGSRGLRDIGASDRAGIDFAAVEARGYPVVKAVTTAYWRAYLLGDRAAADWLRQDGDVKAK
jgi:dienelactone hydrolase